MDSSVYLVYLPRRCIFLRELQASLDRGLENRGCSHIATIAPLFNTPYMYMTTHRGDGAQ